LLLCIVKANIVHFNFINEKIKSNAFLVPVDLKVKTRIDMMPSNCRIVPPAVLILFVALWYFT
jgi:hypothetical protein